jgi:hypothetical protein
VKLFAQYANMTVNDFMGQHRLKQEQCKLQGIDYMGPTVHEYNQIIHYMKRKVLIQNILIGLYNWTIGSLRPSTKISYRITHNEMPLNHAKLVDDLIFIHGHEVLIDGIVSSRCTV